MSPELHPFRTYTEHTREESAVLKEVRNVDVARQFRKVHSYVGDVFPRVIPQRSQVIFLILKEIDMQLVIIIKSSLATAIEQK